MTRQTFPEGILIDDLRSPTLAFGKPTAGSLVDLLEEANEVESEVTFEADFDLPELSVRELAILMKRRRRR